MLDTKVDVCSKRNGSLTNTVYSDGTTTVSLAYDRAGRQVEARDAADSDVVRTETRYAIQDGEAILIGRTWTRCRREDRNGYPAVIVETSRAADAQSVPFGDSSANSWDATWDADSPLVPLVLKGRTCESLDENGILT